MAHSMRDIKDKISSTHNMSKITSAMQMVAGAKLTKSETQQKNFQNYINTIEEVMGKISVENHPFFKVGSTGTVGYLVMTSDRGLAGGYNINILKLLESKISQSPYRLYMIGEKGFQYAKAHDLPIENEEIFVPEHLVYNDIKPVIDLMLSDYAEGKIQQIVVIYTNYVSKIVQVPEEKQILPLQPLKKSKEGSSISYLMEPSDESVLDILIPQYLEGIIYGAIMTSKLSEQAARMSTMQNATDNALAIIGDLQLTYNRARQAAITEEINEIVGGASAI